MKTKSESVATLVKDVVLGVIFGSLIAYIAYSNGNPVLYLYFWIGLGIPSGWHLMSKVLPVTVTIYGIVLKLAGAIFLGIVAFPIVMIMDIKSIVE